MRAPLVPFLLAATVTLLVAAGVTMTPYFAGDVAAARAVQSAAPDPGWWATPVSRLAPAPAKYYVMGLTAILAFALAGFRGLLLAVAFIALEQYGAEHTKAWFSRPRPSRELIAVVGSPSGFTFPSTTITFFSVTFGLLAVVASRIRKTPLAIGVLVAGSVMVVLGCLARVALGAHWPSDVALTVIICLAWIWAASRIVIRRG
ncbi:MAG: phosphatase PAP2 family protein [Acidobacteriota bacterium]|nr:phosphatase PAP2 family protein [Acidobacteriota bacterium]